MKTRFLFSLLFFFTFTFSHLSPTTTATAGDDSGDTDFIRASCNTTLYPDLCFASLSRFASTVQRSPAGLARVAVAVALSKAHGAAAYLSHQTAVTADDDDSGVGAALHDCFANLEDAVDEIRGSLKQIRGLRPEADSGSVRFGLSNVLTWMSAALTDEETCTDGFEGVAEGPVKANVCDRVTRVKKFTSNALALVNGFANKNA
ncbi:Pectinesterase inhibitor 7, partial [Mucuna pruriens]